MEGKKLVLKIKLLDEDIAIDYSTEGSAGIDLRASGRWEVELDEGGRWIAAESLTLNSLERVTIGSGICVEIPEGYFGHIGDRSGHAKKHGLHIMGGRIDHDYRGEVGILAINLSRKPYTISKNERITQLVLTRYGKVEIKIVKQLSETERGGKGWGSSGTH
jgi:dUTP pyrophosphatase